MRVVEQLLRAIYVSDENLSKTESPQLWQRKIRLRTKLTQFSVFLLFQTDCDMFESEPESANIFCHFSPFLRHFQGFEDI